MSARRHLKYYFKVIEKASYWYCSVAQLGFRGISAKGLEVIPNRGLSEAGGLPAGAAQNDKGQCVRMNFFPGN
jgi:hypothetical protein